MSNPLSDVEVGEPHVSAHNDERAVINQLQTDVADCVTTEELAAKGYIPLPAGGSTGQALVKQADGSVAFGTVSGSANTYDSGDYS